MPKLSINGNLYSPKLILFDVDGTLVDDANRYKSLGKVRYIEIKKIASLNAAKEWARITGVNTENWTIDPNGPISKAPRREDLALAAGALYLDGYNWHDARKISEKIYNKADEVQRKTFKPHLYDGVEAKLRDLKKAGFILGVATNGSTNITEELLSDLGIIELFNVVVGADLVEKSKPAPDMILLACEKTRNKTSECIYVGDQPMDIEAAHKAQVMISVGVGHINLAKKGAGEALKSLNEIQII
jgi:phosphoglycolate phosphatase